MKYFCIFLGILMLSSCGKKTPPLPQPPKALTVEERVKKGAELYKKLNCQACHSLHERGGSNAPDLSEVGKKYIQLKGSEEKAREWFVNHLKDPDKFPGTEKAKYHVRMVKYPNPEEDFFNVATYLLTLK